MPAHRPEQLNSHYEAFFSRLTGEEPYSYQKKLAGELAKGNSVILRAPTGSGKTWATIAPFVHSFVNNNKFADRLIYALPLRSLATNLYESTSGKLNKLAELQGHISSSARKRKYNSSDPFYVSLQMGGQQDDPFFEGDLTFTTIDQLLSAYLFAPVSLPDRVGNIGAGALIGSLLVFDEIHLLDPKRSLATTIEMLSRLKDLAQFVLMTATMPDSVMQWLGNKLEAKSISLSADEVKQLPSHACKRREFEWFSLPICAQKVIDEHENRTIVIVNTVERAQEIFKEVCKMMEGQTDPPQIFLLHARFFPEDRKKWESKLVEYFGPDATLSNAILISTQVIEAGMDISADVLLSELVPLNSLLQRAGRVARYFHRNVGRFLVFDLLTDANGRSKLGPYRDIPEIITATRELLASKAKLPLLDYAEELDWLKSIHERPDLEALAHLNSLHAHTQNVLKAIDGFDDAACSRLVREVGSINVVLASEPEILRFNGREWPELLSVPRTSLFKLKEACAHADLSEWILKVPEEIQSESSPALNFRWGVITNPANVAWLVAVNPAYANYSEKIGLEIGKPSNHAPKIRYKASPPITRYSYHREPFIIHARRVSEAGERILSVNPQALCRLNQRYPQFDLNAIYALACALHDTGKLQVAWQNQAEKWQERIDAKLRRDHKPEPLAHTEFDPERDRDEQWCRFPPHAACGGFALLPYFLEHFPHEIAVLLCTAITRHHGTHTSELNQFELMQNAVAILKDCLPDSVPSDISVQSKSQSGDSVCFSEDWLLHFVESENWWPLYANVIRVLRLADQGSLQN